MCILSKMIFSNCDCLDNLKIFALVWILYSILDSYPKSIGSTPMLGLQRRSSRSGNILSTPLLFCAPFSLFFSPLQLLFGFLHFTLHRFQMFERNFSAFTTWLSRLLDGIKHGSKFCEPISVHCCHALKKKRRVLRSEMSHLLSFRQITCMYSLAVWTNSWYTMWSAVNPIPKSADVGCKWAGMPKKKRYFKYLFGKYQKFVYFQHFDEFLVFPSISIFSGKS